MLLTKKRSGGGKYVSGAVTLSDLNIRMENKKSIKNNSTKHQKQNIRIILRAVPWTILYSMLLFIMYVLMNKEDKNITYCNNTNNNFSSISNILKIVSAMYSNKSLIF